MSLNKQQRGQQHGNKKELLTNNQQRGLIDFQILPVLSIKGFGAFRGRSCGRTLGMRSVVPVPVRRFGGTWALPQVVQVVVRFSWSGTTNWGLLRFLRPPPVVTED